MTGRGGRGVYVGVAGGACDRAERIVAHAQPGCERSDGLDSQVRRVVSFGHHMRLLFVLRVGRTDRCQWPAQPEPGGNPTTAGDGRAIEGAITAYSAPNCSVVPRLVVYREKAS